MASFGGETPVNAVTINGSIVSGTVSIYTVPAGRYARVTIHGVGTTGSPTNPAFAVRDPSVIKLLATGTYDGTTFYMNSGDVLYGIASGGTGTLRATAIEFNNP